MLKRFSFNLPGCGSIPDDEQDYDNKDNLTDEERDRIAVDHLSDHCVCCAQIY